jgi:hypothetical protein
MKIGELSKPQRRSLRMIWKRPDDWWGFAKPPYRHFLRSAAPEIGRPDENGFRTVMVACGRIWIGVEPDGYPHS